jgi:hypothetical protein
LQYKYLNEKSHNKLISSRSTNLDHLPKFLSVSETQRKNYYVSGSNLDLINKQMKVEILKDLKQKYYQSGDKKELQMLELLGVLSCINEESLLQIRDYSLSTYFVFYQGANPII